VLQKAMGESDFRDIGSVVGETDARRGDADGVLVVSAWTRGVNGTMLARVTMSGGDPSPMVRVVTSPDELHAVIDEWLELLQS